MQDNDHHNNHIKTDLLPRSPYDVRYTPDQFVAGFAFEIQTGLHAFASDRVTPFVTPPSTLAFTPVGCDVFSRSNIGGEYLTVALRKDSIIAIYDRDDLQTKRYNNGANPLAHALAEKLRNQLLVSTDDQFAIEETAIQLFEYAAFSTDENLHHHKAASSMTPKRWKQFHELLEANLCEPLHLERIAQTLGLSSSFFIRSFKAATGSTPHAYIIRRRINKARALLSENKVPTATIAADVGFANQAHMTTVFKKHLGVTPRKYQRITVN